MNHVENFTPDLLWVVVGLFSGQKGDSGEY